MKTLLYLSLTLASCRLFAQPTNPAWSHLPPDAAAIYDFNLAVLTAKIPWYALAAPIPEAQRHTDNRELVSILRRPDNAGVDVRHNLYVIDQSDSVKTTSFLLLLVDTARWTAFLRLQDPGLHLIALGGDTCFAGREKMGVAWNNRYAVLTFVHRGLSHEPRPGETRKLAIHRSLAILKGYDSSSCIREPLFRVGFADDADIHVWSRHGQLLHSFLHLLLSPDQPSNNRPIPGAGPCLHTLSSLRFEKGRILLTSTICLPPGADSLYARLIDHTLSTHLTAHLPQTTALGMCSLHFNPGLLGDLLTQLQTRGVTEGLLFDKGLSLESFAHGFEGDFLLMATHSDAANGRLPITLCFAASTLDPPAVAQWTGKLHPSDCTLRDSLLWIGHLPDTVAATPLVFTDHPLPATPVASTDHAAPSAPDSALLSRLSDPSAPLSGYLDCKALAAYWKDLPLLSAMDKLSFTAGRLDAAGRIVNTFELTLADPRAYSLQTLWPLLGP